MSAARASLKSAQGELEMHEPLVRGESRKAKTRRRAVRVPLPPCRVCSTADDMT